MTVSKIIDELAKTKNLSSASFLSSSTLPVTDLLKSMKEDLKKKH